VLATQTFIRERDFGDTLKLCTMLLTDPHDLLHKACGWMLREVGHREPCVLENYLLQHHRVMPRTMLRYAIERFEPEPASDFLLGQPGRETVNRKIPLTRVVVKAKYGGTGCDVGQFLCNGGECGTAGYAHQQTFLGSAAAGVIHCGITCHGDDTVKQLGFQVFWNKTCPDTLDRVGAALPPEITGESAGSTANTLSRGHLALSVWATPLKCPPVPTPVIKMSTPSGKSLMISCAVVRACTSILAGLSNCCGTHEPGTESDKA
jgi:hypothetical protein